MILRSRRLAAAALLLVLLGGCGSNEHTEEPRDAVGSDAAGTASTPAAPSTSAAPEGPTYRLLSKKALTGVLLSVQDLPAGYSQDPPVDEGGNKTFCDYKPPFTEKIRVRQDFTKGGGMSAELLSVGLRQFASPEQAKAAFDAMVTALETCRNETFQGSEMSYAPMSAPKVGEASVGVKISSDGTDLLQNFALVGPTMINVGGGGLMNASVADVTAALEAQVKAYRAAATTQ